jgi:hypothetical protein
MPRRVFRRDSHDALAGCSCFEDRLGRGVVLRAGGRGCARRPCGPARSRRQAQEPPISRARTRRDGRTHRRLRRGREQPEHGVRGHGLGRRLEDHQQWHNLGARVRQRRCIDDRRHRPCAFRSFGGVGRHRRAEQPAELVVGRWRVQVAGRREDLANDGTGRHASHRPHRDPSQKS